MLMLELINSMLLYLIAVIIMVLINFRKINSKILFNIFNNKKLPIYSKGLNVREWIYVKDHCNALYDIYLKGKTGESYNVGSNFNIKNIDLVKKILFLCKRYKIPVNRNSKITFVKDRPGHDFRYAPDSNKIRKNRLEKQN